MQGVPTARRVLKSSTSVFLSLRQKKAVNGPPAGDHDNLMNGVSGFYMENAFVFWISL